MIIYKSTKDRNYRKKKTINMTIEELPQRKQYIFKSPRDMVKCIKKIEQLVRSSIEYKDCIAFLRSNMDMDHCIILRNAIKGDYKKYSIEIHHEPFTLFDIVEIVLAKHQVEGIPINPLLIANEVMELHYSGNDKQGIIGLVPLTATQHELCHNGKIFIPFQYIYHKFNVFYEMYEEYIPEHIQDKIRIKAEMSSKCGSIQSDVLDTNFIYLDVDGFEFPEIPESWNKKLESVSDIIDSDAEIVAPTTYMVGDDI